MKAQIIAEVASNHGGDLRLAREFIHAAAENGADFVKFQSWQAKRMRSDDPQHAWFVQSELSDDAHAELIEECKARGIRFLTTAFDVDRVDFLASLQMPVVKVGSADTASYALLRALRARFPHVILSTGMATDEEVREAAKILASGPFTLMHTVSLYPTPVERASLRRMHWLRTLASSVGYSDHTVGLEAPKVAIAMGAEYVEKHFCLGRTGPGRVMDWDMTPADLAELARFAGEVEVLGGNDQFALLPDLQVARRRFIGRFGDNQ